MELLDISYCYHGDNEALSALMGCIERCSVLRELRVAGWGLAGGDHLISLCRWGDCMHMYLCMYAYNMCEVVSLYIHIHYCSDCSINVLTGII